MELELINLTRNWNWPNGIEWNWNWRNGINPISDNYNTDLAKRHTSRALHITINGGLSHSSMLQTLPISAYHCLAKMHSTAHLCSDQASVSILGHTEKTCSLSTLLWAITDTSCSICCTSRDHATNKNTSAIADTVWTVFVDTEKTRETLLRQKIKDIILRQAW